MLDRLQAVPPDPILGIIAAYAADSNPRKIDLGIGVYRDENIWGQSKNSGEAVVLGFGPRLR